MILGVTLLIFILMILIWFPCILSYSIKLLVRKQIIKKFTLKLLSKIPNKSKTYHIPLPSIMTWSSPLYPLNIF